MTANSLTTPKLAGRINFLFYVLIVTTFSLCSFAQQPKGPAPAPVPAQISSAQRAFISNGGGVSFESIIDDTALDGGPDRPYNEFYAAIKDWNRYDLVSSPADADLVFEISWQLTDTGMKLPVMGQLQITVIDPKTRITLWNLTQYVHGAMLLSNRDKNFDQAMTTIVNRLKIVATPAPAMPAAAGKSN